jgi:hypothetical protein
MSGPRVSTGEDSKQDYGTPREFLDACEKRFGPIIFDLAAHRGNKKHARYFAPSVFTEKYDPEKKFNSDDVIASLIARGAKEHEARAVVKGAVGRGIKTEIKVRNYDPEAHGYDAFSHSWASLYKHFNSLDRKDKRPGVLWLNCEFSDIEPWADRCRQEGELGANILLLTPSAAGSNWTRDQVAVHADIYDLNGRMSFDGKNVYPKDCMLSHYHPGAAGDRHIWQWSKDKLWVSWAVSRVSAP